MSKRKENSFASRYPEMKQQARALTLPKFKQWLTEKCSSMEQNNKAAANHIARLIDYDGRTVREISTDQPIRVDTIETLWEILKGNLPESLYTDMLEDLHNQIKRLKHSDHDRLTRPALLPLMERWALGTDPHIVAIREQNKQRIIELLIDRIGHRTTGKYLFGPELSRPEKQTQVEKWWSSHRFQLSMAIKSPSELNKYLAYSLSQEVMRTLREAQHKEIPFFVTPYYASLLSTDNSFDDSAIRSYVIYSQALVNTYGHIKAWEREDEVVAGKPNAAGWILPEGHNIHRRYPEVAILIPDSMGRACGGLCASCQRMYNFQSKRLNFDLESLKPKESWNQRLRQLMNFFEEDDFLCDILITGGDALMSQNSTLENILDAVCRMATRKRASNLKRPPEKQKTEMKRIRLGTRLPVYLPMRINDELIEILRRARQKGQEAGIKYFMIQTHFQSPLEITPEAMEAVSRILEAGWIVTNQLVHTVAASRIGHTARLRQALNNTGILTYYTFTVKGFEENYDVFAPNARSLQAVAEEKRHGKLTSLQSKELSRKLHSGQWDANTMKRFLDKHKLPYAATERNTLNLPGIGKSMTFQTVGILPDGRRLLRFEHDTTRRHSPSVEKMPDLYIAECKSISAYLRQLEAMGEETKLYRSIWAYTDGTTEPRFSLFDIMDEQKGIDQ